MSWCSEFIMQYVLVGLVCRGGLCCTGEWQTAIATITAMLGPDSRKRHYKRKTWHWKNSELEFVVDFCNQINGCRYNTIYTARLKPGGTPKCFTVRNDGKWLHWTVSH